MSRDFYACGAALKPIEEKKREKFWDTIVKGTSVYGYIIEADGKPAGYALAVPFLSQEAGGTVLWVDELYVSPEFRGRGIAKQFFDYLEKKEKAAIRLEVEPDNLKAIKLYESLGFKPLPYMQMIKTYED